MPTSAVEGVVHIGTKRGGITPFPPWQTKNKNGVEKRYIRLGNSLMLDERVMGLNHLAFRIYTYMILESGGNVIFEFPYAKYRKITSRSNFQRALDELTAAGLVEVHENNANLRKPNKYRFSVRWKDAPGKL